MKISYSPTFNENPNQVVKSENLTFKSVNREYLNKIQEYAKRSGDVPAETIVQLSKDVFNEKMLVADALETLYAIKTYIKTDNLKELLAKTRKNLLMLEKINRFLRK